MLPCHSASWGGVAGAWPSFQRQGCQRTSRSTSSAGDGGRPRVAARTVAPVPAGAAAGWRAEECEAEIGHGTRPNRPGSGSPSYARTLGSQGWCGTQCFARAPSGAFGNPRPNVGPNTTRGAAGALSITNATYLWQPKSSLPRNRCGFSTPTPLAALRVERRPRSSRRRGTGADAMSYTRRRQSPRGSCVATPPSSCSSSGARGAGSRVSDDVRATVVLRP